MKAGRELDALVAEKVMGERIGQRRTTIRDGVQTDEILLAAPGDWCFKLCPPYSTDIAAAWEVVEHLDEDLEFRLWGPREERGQRPAGGWEVELQNRVTGAWYRGVSEESAPHAICLAALKSVG